MRASLENRLRVLIRRELLPLLDGCRLIDQRQFEKGAIDGIKENYELSGRLPGDDGFIEHALAFMRRPELQDRVREIAAEHRA